MKESTLDKIIRKTGMKPISCKCQLCKSQCHLPCKGTPEDMFKLIGGGFQDRLMQFDFQGQRIITPLLDKEKDSCTFFTNGLCELHELGLKPTEGKLSHHSTKVEKFNYKKSITFHVLREWQNLTKEQAAALIEKYIKPKSEPNPEVCDATEADSSTTAGPIK